MMLSSALLLLDAGDFVSAASRCYYSAFNAVSAWFLAQGRHFKKHSALRSAVHKDLVHVGLWPAALGQDFDYLYDLRSEADYGLDHPVRKLDIEAGIAAAGRVLDAVHQLDPNLFPLD